MRRKIARALRKWSDLIDPRTKPSDGYVLTVRIDCDSSHFKSEMAVLQDRVDNFVRSLEAAEAKAQHLPKVP